MFGKYNIVLFKNNKKKKLIKKYHTEKNVYKKFNDLIEENKKILFNKKIENAEPCEYYLSIITNQSSFQKTIVIKDDLGRNKTAELDDPNFVFLEFQPFKIEDLIYDWQTEKKITLSEFLKTYCKTKDLKSIFALNNKICVQKDEDVSIFSLKDKTESDRFLNIVENYFFDSNRSDAIFIRDVSNAQRKWVYEILENKGFDKKRLYRLKTTFSKR